MDRTEKETLDAICNPYKHPDSPCAILCPPRSTTDAHVALQQLSHHVPNQVLPPNRGGRKREGRRKGGCWIWMGGPGSWILISFFLILARKGAVIVVIMYLVLPWYLINAVCSVHLSHYRAFSLLFAPKLVMAHAHISLLVTGSPLEESGGGNVSVEVPCYWHSGLTALWVTNDQKRGA